MSLPIRPGVIDDSSVTAIHRSALEEVEQFERLRPMLLSIAYRILGSPADAQDVVQETWLRAAASGTRPASPRAFLFTVATRISLDRVRSSRRAPEDRRWGLSVPDLPVRESDPSLNPERSAELAVTLSIAASLLLERLTPLELAVFVLREVLAFDYDEIAVTLGRSPAACRQLAVRSRGHLRTGQARFLTDPSECRDLADRLRAAFVEGDVGELCRLLANRVHGAHGVGVTDRTIRRAAVA